MSALQALQSVQFVNAKGKRYAVLSADGDRKKAGWLKWNDVVKDIK